MGIFLKLGGIGGRVTARESHAIAGVVVAEVKFEPEVAAEENCMVEDELVADQPGGNKRGKKRSRKPEGSEPGAIRAVIFEGSVKKSEGHQGQESGIRERGDGPKCS